MSDETLSEEFNATFLAPDTCGSSIRWSVTTSKYSYKDGNLPTFGFSLNVNLTDCARSIGWSSSDIAEADKKLTRAIQELRNARAAVWKARRLRKSLLKQNLVKVDE